MADDSKKLRTDLYWSYTSLALLAVSGVALNVIIARAYDPAALGLFNQAFAFYIIASQFGVAGVHFSVLRSVPLCQRQKERGAVVTSGLIAAACISIIVCIALATFAGNLANLFDSPNLERSLAWVAPSILGFGLNKILFAAFNGVREMRLLAFLQSLRYVLLIASALTFAIIDVHVADLAAMFLITETTLCFISISLAAHKRLISKFQWSRFKAHLIFGGKGFLSGVLVETNTRVDVIVLGIFTTDHTVGVYSFAAMLAEGYYNLLVVIRNNLNPLIAQYIGTHRWTDIGQLVKVTRLYVYPILLVLGLFIVGTFEPAIDLVLGPSPMVEGKSVLAILLIAIWSIAGFAPFEWILSQSGAPFQQTKLAAFTVLTNIALNLYAVPRWGMLGCATATAMSFIGAAIYLSILSRRHVGFDLFTGKKHVAQTP